MSAQRSGYVAYLLRLWQARDAEGVRWRASLEDIRTGQRQGFASLEELFEFLRTRMEVTMEDSETDSGHELR
jgi:hypothetical protein